MKVARLLAGSIVLALALPSQGSLAASEGQEASRVRTADAPLPEAGQLVVVTTEGWNSHRGRLERFVRQGDQWRRAGEPSPVSLGRSGLAWGRGLLPPPKGTRLKREGDGRSPAGVFGLGTAFGSAQELPEESQGYPYLAASKTSYCVEDTRSEYYNQLIDAKEVRTSGWQQWSALDRPDGLFRWGVFVNQNIQPTEIGAGSCIFLHVWRAAGVGTAGCTAMPLAQVADLVAWLKPGAEPLLVQLPRAAYRELSPAYGLPALSELPVHE